MVVHVIQTHIQWALLQLYSDLDLSLYSFSRSTQSTSIWIWHLTSYKL